MLKRNLIVFILAAALLALSACGGLSSPAATADPYAGMVQVQSGYGSEMWVKDYGDLPVNTLDDSLFSYSGSYMTYRGTDAEALCGIDVSEHQAQIDWAAVAADGVEFAMIRVGYRGYSEGGVHEDACFQQNIEGALANGIRVGVYFFSQAVTPDEAVEEADFTVNLIKDYQLDMPVMFDWENIEGETARTNGLDGDTITKCAAAFCAEVEKAGCTAGVYAYRYLAYFSYDLDALKNYKLWISAVGDSPDFYYRHDMWQYSITGTVAGIDGAVDLDLLFRWAEAEPSPSASPSPTV